MNKLVSLLLLVLAVVFLQLDVDAQCAMCKQVAEDASDSSGNAVGLGLNNGIKYLLIIPYILFGLFLLVFFRKRLHKA